MISLDYLQYFVEVANCGSISKAAQKCFLERSNLSTIISRIENHFDAELFKRTSKGTTLTPEGKKVFAWATQLLAEHQQLISEFQQNRSLNFDIRHLTLYTSVATNEGIYAKPINKLVEQFPTLSINVRQVNEGTHDLNNILEKENNIGLFTLSDRDINYLNQYPALRFITLINVQFAAYASPESELLKNYSTISLKTLSTMPLLLYTFNDQSPLLKFLQSYGAGDTIINTVTTPTMLQHLLSTGNFVSIGTAPPQIPPVLESMKYVPIRDKIPLYFGILLHKSNINNPIITTLLTAYCELLHLPNITDIL